MNKHTNWSRLAAGALALSLLSGCGAEKAAAESKTVTLDPSNPVSLTVWHYYNGAQQSAFDELVSEFNATVGKEKGIYVEGYSQGSVSDLEKAVTAAAAGSVGSQELPNIFSTYADTAYAMQQQGKLADLSRFFSAEELSEYVDAYIQEGYFHDDGALYIFPVAKSTEITMINTTDWQPFADATGAEYAAPPADCRSSRSAEASGRSRACHRQWKLVAFSGGELQRAAAAHVPGFSGAVRRHAGGRSGHGICPGRDHAEPAGQRPGAGRSFRRSGKVLRPAGAGSVPGGRGPQGVPSGKSEKPAGIWQQV